MARSGVARSLGAHSWVARSGVARSFARSSVECANRYAGRGALRMKPHTRRGMERAQRDHGGRRGQPDDRPAGRRVGDDHHRRPPGQRAQGHVGDSGRRAHRHPDSSLLRPPATGARRGLSPVSGRGGGATQADGLLHHHRHPRHGGAHPADVGGCRQGPARRHGTVADQPSAGLPGVRQGWRVPVAEPGDVQRAGRHSLHRRQAHLPQTDQPVGAGAAGPGALRAVRPVHPVLQPGRR